MPAEHTTPEQPTHQPKPITQPTRKCGACGGKLRWHDAKAVAAWQTGHGARQGRFSHLATCATCGRTHNYRNLDGFGPNEWVMADETGYFRPLEYNAGY